MKYYRDESNRVFAYNAMQTPRDGLVPMTETETEAHLNPVPTTEQLAATARVERPFPGSEEVDYDVVRGYDGKLYKFGEEPEAPKLYEEPEPIVISSNTITYSDADLLYKASKNGNEIATWLINKLDL